MSICSFIDLFEPRHPSLSLTKQLIQRPVEHVRLRLLHIIAMILFNFGKIGYEIHLMQLDKFRLLENLPADEEYREKEDLESRISICMRYRVDFDLP